MLIKKNRCEKNFSAVPATKFMNEIPGNFTGHSRV